MNSIGHRVKQLRKATGLSQLEFARRIGVSDVTISAWETGAKSPRYSTWELFKKFEERFYQNKSIDYVTLNTIPERLKHIRKEIGLSQRDLSELLDVSMTTIGNWENGHNSPQGENLNKIEAIEKELAESKEAKKETAKKTISELTDDQIKAMIVGPAEKEPEEVKEPVIEEPVKEEPKETVEEPLPFVEDLPELETEYFAQEEYQEESKEEVEKEVKEEEELPAKEVVDSDSEKLVRSMLRVMDAKEEDYGESFHASFDEYGLVVGLIKMDEKMRKLKSLNKSGRAGKVDILDALVDLLGDTLMTIQELDKDK